MACRRNVKVGESGKGSNVAVLSLKNKTNMTTRTNADGIASASGTAICTLI